MKEINLNRGRVALVDDADYDRVNAHKWRVYNQGGSVCAARWRDEGLGSRREVMHVFLLDPPHGSSIKHLNDNRLDNRRENLDLCIDPQSRTAQAQYQADVAFLATAMAETNKRQGYITRKDIMAVMGVSRPTARTYWNLLLEEGGWTELSPPVWNRSRGRPPMRLRRT